MYSMLTAAGDNRTSASSDLSSSEWRRPVNEYMGTDYKTTTSCTENHVTLWPTHRSERTR